MKNWKNLMAAALVAIGLAACSTPNGDGTDTRHYSTNLTGRLLSNNRVQMRAMVRIESACVYGRANARCMDVDHQACFVAVHDHDTPLGTDVAGGAVQNTIGVGGGAALGSLAAGFGGATALANAKFDGPFGTITGAFQGGDVGAQLELQHLLMCDAAKGQAGGYSVFAESFVSSGSPTVLALNPDGTPYVNVPADMLSSNNPAVDTLNWTPEMKEAWNFCSRQYQSAAAIRANMQKLSACAEARLSDRSPALSREAPSRRQDRATRQYQDSAQPGRRSWD